MARYYTQNVIIINYRKKLQFFFKTSWVKTSRWFWSNCCIFKINILHLGFYIMYNSPAENIMIFVSFILIQKKIYTLFTLLTVIYSNYHSCYTIVFYTINPKGLLEPSFFLPLYDENTWLSRLPIKIGFDITAKYRRFNFSSP